MSTSVLLSEEKSGDGVEFSGERAEFCPVLCCHVGVVGGVTRDGLNACHGSGSSSSNDGGEHVATGGGASDCLGTENADRFDQVGAVLGSTCLIQLTVELLILRLNGLGQVNGDGGDGHECCSFDPLKIPDPLPRCCVL